VSGVLAYAGDAVAVLALSIMFSLSVAVRKARPGEGRLRLWLLPALAVLVSFPLGYLARTWPADVVQAGLVFGARALAGSLLAIAHLSVLQRR
jgi:hypothetical protein